ncbi:2'-5' RNA ligase family protein [Actinomadura sp. ATCC 31491]|uniref:2'-5' RNA ligase family protein n=1 Tax=Actinomadura luzonensis TaxID=2805427 RepID=A0ABT0G052_9ACTN|nr:2'-5' RNA ligase family protein [Actinomadura luzonensis]MCK2217930.1 2'-5' RNA ligase family protein [Actinomadura luzonensis]
MADEVRAHWWPREGWRPGRLACTWHLTFERAPRLHRLAERYQEALARVPGHHPVPVRWLHLTMQSVGWADEVPPTRLDAVAAAVAVRLRRLPPFTLTFHRAAVAGEGVVLEPAPADAVRRLRDEVRAGIAAVTPVPEPAGGFWPHVSLTYAGAPGSAGPYEEALRAVTAGPAEVEVDRVALIVQERVLAPEWVYRWTTRAEARLGG